MSKFIIHGGKQLNGQWRVQGMKNAATPVLAATLLTRKPCIVHNIPRISDIDHMLAILEDLGAKVEWLSEHTVKIHTPEIRKNEMNYLLTKRMRSSVLLMGPVLSVLGSTRMPEPGGCNIGNRPLAAHLEAFKALGAFVILAQDKYYTIEWQKNQGKEKESSDRNIRLIERSVTATENVMMASSRLQGKTIISNCAREPHIACLGEFLRAIGVDVQGHGTDEIIMQGREDLDGAEFEIIPDQLEVGTIAIVGALAGGSIEISPVIPNDMKSVLEKLEQAGAIVKQKDNSWIVSGSLNNLKAFEIETAPYPGFPTDLQAVFGLLATQAKGESKIYDPMYENRLAYIDELKKMGATARIHDPHTALISGHSKLKGASINSLDLRAGATLIIAGLIANGETIIDQAEIIDRGYENIDGRLRELGADIKRVD